MCFLDHADVLHVGKQDARDHGDGGDHDRDCVHDHANGHDGDGDPYLNGIRQCRMYRISCNRPRLSLVLLRLGLLRDGGGFLVVHQLHLRIPKSVCGIYRSHSLAEEFHPLAL